jgi:hypothetical protein
MTTKTTLISLICILFAIGCKNRKKQMSEFTPSIDSVKIIFNKDRPFQIIKSARSFTSQSSSKDTNACKDWTIKNEDLPKIISDSRIISGTEWDLSFLVLPCIIKGQLKQDGKLFNIEVNGGSWLYVESSDTTLILGNFKKEDEKYFIDKPYRE